MHGVARPVLEAYELADRIEAFLAAADPVTRGRVVCVSGVSLCIWL